MALLRNELDYQKQVRNGETAEAALEWSIVEIERLRAALIQVRAVCEDNPNITTNFIDEVARKALNKTEDAALA